MASIKYFHGTTELRHPYNMPNKEFEAKFPGVKGKRFDSFSKLVGHDIETKEVRPVERKIEYKAYPSLHRCGARCINATGPNCECACGGKNHGVGHFAATPVDAGQP